MLMKGGDPLFSSCSDKEKMPVNSVFKYGLVFLGGLVVGALGATAASEAVSALLMAAFCRRDRFTLLSSLKKKGRLAVVLPRMT